MNTNWHTESGRLACRWSELPQRVPYNPGWMREGTSTGAEPTAPCFLDFRRLVGWAGGDGSNPTPGTAASRANYRGV